MMKFVIVQCFTAKGLELFFLVLGRTIAFGKERQIFRPKFNYMGGYSKKLLILFTMLICTTFLILLTL